MAAVLSLAMFALPLALNHCIASCDAHLSATPTSGPSCHHPTSTALLSPIAGRCGHEHDAAVTTVGATSRLAQTNASVAVIVAPVRVMLVAAHYVISSSRPPGSGPAVDGPSLPLRI